MKKVTQFDKRSYDMGQRVRECRELRKLTQKELADRIFLLPENGGKTRSEKQLAYIENGNRKLSNDYAVLIAKALNVRIEYLLLIDGYKTEDERLHKIVDTGHTRFENIESLISLHGYKVSLSEQPGFSCSIQYPPGISDKDALELIHSTEPDSVIEIKAPNGDTRYIGQREYLRIIRDVDNYVEMQMAFLFRKLTDGAKEYW